MAVMVYEPTVTSSYFTGAVTLAVVFSRRSATSGYQCLRDLVAKHAVLCVAKKLSPAAIVCCSVCYEFDGTLLASNLFDHIPVFNSSVRREENVIRQNNSHLSSSRHSARRTTR